MSTADRVADVAPKRDPNRLRVLASVIVAVPAVVLDGALMGLISRAAPTGQVLRTSFRFSRSIVITR